MAGVPRGAAGRGGSRCRQAGITAARGRDNPRDGTAGCIQQHRLQRRKVVLPASLVPCAVPVVGKLDRQPLHARLFQRGLVCVNPPLLPIQHCRQGRQAGSSHVKHLPGPPDSRNTSFKSGQPAAPQPLPPPPSLAARPGVLSFFHALPGKGRARSSSIQLLPTAATLQSRQAGRRGADGIIQQAAEAHVGRGWARAPIRAPTLQRRARSEQAAAPRWAGGPRQAEAAWQTHLAEN